MQNHDAQGGSSKKTSKPSSLVEVIHKGRKLFIHKSTAVWIFQEGDRVSADQTIRVREKQPGASSTSKSTPACIAMAFPDKCDTLSIGDVCVFSNKKADSSSGTCDWSIGKVLQFAYYLEKNKKARQYAGSYVTCNEDTLNKIGIVCSWCSSISIKHTYSFQTGLKATTHCFIPLNLYICTLPFECFESVEAAEMGTGGVVAVPLANKSISLKSFLSNETVLRIDLLYKMYRPQAKAASNKKFNYIY